MLYHQVTSENPLEVLLNLEELVCLSSILGQKAFVWPNEVAKKYCNLNCFEIVCGFPEHLISFNISDYVCMFNADLNSLEGSEFLSYRSKQNKIYTRLDKFLVNDFLIVFSKANYYESKYFTSNIELIHQSYDQALDYDVSEGFRAEYDFFTHMLPKMPLVFLENIDNKPLERDFFYISERDIFFDESLNAINIKEYFKNYSEDIKEVDTNMLIYLMSDNFTDVYGLPGNYLFGAISKKKFKQNREWEPKLTRAPSGGLLENHCLKDVEPFACFEFAKKNLNTDRSNLMSVLRFRDCCVNNFVN